jgi:hypothetical protein
MLAQSKLPLVLQLKLQQQVVPHSQLPTQLQVQTYILNTQLVIVLTAADVVVITVAVMAAAEAVIITHLVQPKSQLRLLNQLQLLQLLKRAPNLRWLPILMHRSCLDLKTSTLAAVSI